jgi:hypothetical protein
MAGHRFLYNLTLYCLSLFLLLPTNVVTQDTEGSLILYLDGYCYTANSVLSTVPLALNTCLVPLGIEGVVVGTYPSCPGGGNSILITYKDTACGLPGGHTYKDTCFYYGIEPIPGVMFACEDVARNPRPTSIQTITATRPPASMTTLIPSASQTGEQGTGSKGPAMTAPAQSNGLTKSTPSSTAAGTAPTSGNQQEIGSGSGASTMSTDNKIALGVGIGVGVAAIIIAFLAWRFPQVPKSIIHTFKR